MTIRPTQDDWQRIRRSVLKTERSTALDAVPKRRKWPFQGTEATAGTIEHYRHFRNKVSDRFITDEDERLQFTVAGISDSDVGIRQSGTSLIQFTKSGVFFVSFAIQIESESGSSYGAREFELSSMQYRDDQTAQGIAWKTAQTVHNFSPGVPVNSAIADRFFCIHPSFVCRRSVNQFLDIGVQQIGAFNDPRPALVTLRYFSIVLLGP